MNAVLTRYVNCLRLNWCMAGLVLRRRWLRSAHVAAGYDRVAATYDRQWLSQLQPVTDALLQRIPHDLPPGEILDLGCGTGYTTCYLATLFSDRPVVAVDLSAGMLAAAQRRLGDRPGISWRQQDMLSFLRQRPACGDALVLSTWALGYSHHRALIRHVGRVLRPGGVFAFVVNYADTLLPVFQAFHQCLARFPGEIELALWPDFPPSWPALRTPLERAGLDIVFHEDLMHPVAPPPEYSGSRFDWLLTTGVLAGFDAVLPLRARTPAAEFLHERLEHLAEPLQHHCASVVAVRRGEKGAST
jgi:SAM-dependent methyltransferase